MTRALFRNWFNLWLARAWAYGYNTRAYDDSFGVVTPNPYDGTFPTEESDA